MPRHTGLEAQVRPYPPTAISVSIKMLLSARAMCSLALRTFGTQANHRAACDPTCGCDPSVAVVIKSTANRQPIASIFIHLCNAVACFGVPACNVVDFCGPVSVAHCTPFTNKPFLSLSCIVSISFCVFTVLAFHSSRPIKPNSRGSFAIASANCWLM